MNTYTKKQIENLLKSAKKELLLATEDPAKKQTVSLIALPPRRHWRQTGDTVARCTAKKGETRMAREIKKYQGMSGRQILKASKICQMSGGEWQICYQDMIVMVNEDADYISLSSVGGAIAPSSGGQNGRRLRGKIY
jgi:hypothetical protein